MLPWDPISTIIEIEDAFTGILVHYPCMNWFLSLFTLELHIRI